MSKRQTKAQGPLLVTRRLLASAGSPPHKLLIVKFTGMARLFKSVLSQIQSPHTDMDRRA
jgi:hypothetical protein